MSIKPSSAQCQGSCFQQENTYTAAELKKVKLFFLAAFNHYLLSILNCLPRVTGDLYLL